MNLDDLLSQTCPWLLGSGEKNGTANDDIVIACRIRLTRNLVGFPFPIRATELDRYTIQDAVHHVAEEHFAEEDYYYADTQALSPLDREYLYERQLISREIVISERTHAVLIDRQERFNITVNEEDHVQINATGSGFSPERVWEQANDIDNLFADKLDYVFHEKYGFLTSSLINVGTGMRIGTILHLPALVITGEMDKVARTLQKKNLTVRGLYGEGSRAYGDFFLVGNRVTLGKSEEELIAKMTDLVPQIVSFERQARSYLMNSRIDFVRNRCSQSINVLRTAQMINSVEAMLHLSNIRLGIHTELIKGISIDTINTLLLHILPAHLQKMQGNHLSQTEQDVVRATYIRVRIG